MLTRRTVRGHVSNHQHPIPPFETMSIDEIIKLILGSGGVLACLVFAVRWLGGDLQRKELRLETEREKRFEELIAAHSKLEEEREKRISALA